MKKKSRGTARDGNGARRKTAAKGKAQAKSEGASPVRAAAADSDTTAARVPRRREPVDLFDEEPIRIRTVKKEAILPYLATLLLVGAGYLVFIVYSSYAWPAFIAILFFVVFDPLHRRFLKWFRGNRKLSAAATTLLVVLIMFGPVYFLIQQLVYEIIDLVQRVRDNLASDQLFDTIRSSPILSELATGEPFFWVRIQNIVFSAAQDYISFFDPDRVGNLLGNATSFLWGSLNLTLALLGNMMLGFILLYFMFSEGPAVRGFLIKKLPFPREITDRFISRMRDVITAVVRGNIFISILQGAALGLGFAICGFANIYIWGLIAAFFSLIPVVGTSVVWLPAVLYMALVEGRFGFALFLSIYGVALYLLLENIVKPLILDKQLGMHPLLLFLAIIGGLAEFGITGVILGPLFVTLFMAIWSIYHIWESEEDRIGARPGNGDRAGESASSAGRVS